MIIGYTGTRLGMTGIQTQLLGEQLRALGARTLHHGDCQGADFGAHLIARSLGLLVVVHPPTGEGLRAFTVADETREAQEYMARNHMIVLESEVLIACPDGPERRRSGTWATVRYAKRLNRQVIVITPAGEIIRSNFLSDPLLS